jgi:hypothetical protein
MRRLDAGGPFADELKELRREQAHRAGRQLIGAVIVFRILADRLKIGAEDEGRSVDEKDVISGLYRAMVKGMTGFAREEWVGASIKREPARSYVSGAASRASASLRACAKRRWFQERAPLQCDR